MEEGKNKQKRHTEITINDKWCKKCGICIAFCPKGVFVADKFGKPVVKYPEQCIKCMLCVVRCPDFAVDVKEADKKKNP